MTAKMEEGFKSEQLARQQAKKDLDVLKEEMKKKKAEIEKRGNHWGKSAGPSFRLQVQWNLHSEEDGIQWIGHWLQTV